MSRSVVRCLAVAFVAVAVATFAVDSLEANSEKIIRTAVAAATIKTTDTMSNPA